MPRASKFSLLGMLLVGCGFPVAAPPPSPEPSALDQERLAMLQREDLRTIEREDEQDLVDRYTALCEDHNREACGALVFHIEKRGLPRGNWGRPGVQHHGRSRVLRGRGQPDL